MQLESVSDQRPQFAPHLSGHAVVDARSYWGNPNVENPADILVRKGKRHRENETRSHFRKSLLFSYSKKVYPCACADSSKSSLARSLDIFIRFPSPLRKLKREGEVSQTGNVAASSSSSSAPPVRLLAACPPVPPATNSPMPI